MAENGDLIEAAHDRLNYGRLHESLQYQMQLQQNLIYLATIADDDPSLEPVGLRRDADAVGGGQPEPQPQQPQPQPAVPRGALPPPAAGAPR